MLARRAPSVRPAQPARHASTAKPTKAATKTAAKAPKASSVAHSLHGRSVITASQFDRAQIEHLLASAKKMSAILKKTGGTDLLKNRVLGNLFYEPSTRTASSFHGAMVRLGGSVIPVSSATSSAQKGETLADTIRVMENYVDGIVIRHAESGSAAVAAAHTKKPVINAGDGANEHPTQALLDMHMINCELGGLDGLTVSLVGDLKFGRTVHSLSQLLDRFNIARLNLVAPAGLRIPTDVLEKVKNIKVHQTSSLEEVLSSSDVVYQTRIQKERFASLDEYNALKGTYVVTADTMAKMKKKSLLLHPLPRVDEIVPAVDSDPRAGYFRQPGYGLEMRMAILAHALAKH